ncbi:MAG: response regulator [Chloroherpetonaceae bacterium]|nr:response regulator [Chloroherpetonaceae bacterium]
MPGMGGLNALTAIKSHLPFTPIVMITKNETESIMDEAIGRNIAEYLIKPVNPHQILLACKKLLDAERIKGNAATQGYVQEFNRISRLLLEPLTAEDWIDIYRRLAEWEVEFDSYPQVDLRQTLLDQKRECNAEFGKFIERNYRDWIFSDRSARPMLSVQCLRPKSFPSYSEW